MWWCGTSMVEPREDGTDQFDQICEALIGEGNNIRAGNRIGYYLMELFKLERDTKIVGALAKKQHVIDELSQTKADSYAEMQRDATDEQKFQQLQLKTQRCEHIIKLLKLKRDEQQRLISSEKEMWLDL